MTMNTSMRELLSAISIISHEKGITREQVSDAIRDGIITSMRKNFPETAIIKIEFDEDQGMIRGYRLFNLVNQIEDVNCQMLFNEITDELVIEDVVYEEFPVDLNRQQINITKQVTFNKIKNFSHNKHVELLLQDEFNIFYGTVKVSRRDEFIVDCRGTYSIETTEIHIPKAHCLPRDSYSIGDKIFFTIIREKNNWIGSRTATQFVLELFKSKIPEVAKGAVEIVACARNPGFRSKVIVRSHDPRVNALAVCIGSRGATIKGINNFMNNENVDVIEYDENIANLLVNSIAPITVNSIVVDEDAHILEVSIPDDLISKASKNMDLISRLLDWKIYAYSETFWSKRNNSETQSIIELFIHALNCNYELAEMLATDGFTDLESIIYTPDDEFSDLDLGLVQDLKNNARETIGDEAKMSIIGGIVYMKSQDLTQEQIHILQEAAVCSLQDIADLATDEFLDFLPDFDKVKASAIIMKARQLTEPEVTEEN